MKLTSTQVAARLDINPYTLKRWYEIYNDLTEEEIEENHEQLGMPKLPPYEVVGTRGDRLWEDTDVEAIRAFKDWRPLTKNGFLKNMKSKGE